MAILRPSSDISTGGWTSTAATAAEVLDEVSASDADYIETATIGNKCRISLGTYTDPGNDNNHEIHYRASSADANHGLITRLLEIGAPALITRKRPWRKQPQGYIQVSKQALSRGLQHLWVPGVGTNLDLVGGWHLAPNGAGASIQPGVSGLAYDTNGTHVYTISGEPRTFPGIKFLWVGICRIDTDSITAFGPSGNSYTDGGYVLARFPGGTFYASSGVNADGLASWTGAAYTVGTWATFAVQVRESDNFPVLWINGNRIGAGSKDFDNALIVKQLIGFLGYPPDCAVAFSGLWDGPQEDAYVESILKNVWQVFEPKKQPSFYYSSIVIASHTKTAAQLGTSPADQTLALSTGEASTITNGAELALEFEATTP